MGLDCGRRRPAFARVQRLAHGWARRQFDRRATPTRRIPPCLPPLPFHSSTHMALVAALPSLLRTSSHFLSSTPCRTFLFLPNPSCILPHSVRKKPPYDPTCLGMGDPILPHVSTGAKPMRLANFIQAALGMMPLGQSKKGLM